MRGIDLYLILRELLGRRDGLCNGRGGHMHLFSRERAVAFFGEGAINQGMLMESMNLAVVWKLPVVFVCKDDEWSLLSISSSMTGGTLDDRAKSFGIPALEVDGNDVKDVWRAAAESIERARRGGGPSFLHARCVHFEGHFLGDPLLRIFRHPLRESRKMAGPLLRSAFSSGGTSRWKRIGRLIRIAAWIRKATKDRRSENSDPIAFVRRELAAVILEAGLPAEFRRVCTDGTIPYARPLEDEAFPNTKRILEAAWRLTKG